MGTIGATWHDKRLPGIREAGAASWPLWAALTSAALVGTATGFNVLLAVAPGVGIGLLLLWRSAHFRLAFVLFGGMATINSDQPAVKYCYYFGLALAVLAATVRFLSTRRPMPQSVLPVIGASGLCVLVLLMSLFVALSHGTSAVSWLRIGGAYLVFAAVPIMAIDAASSLSPRAIGVMLGSAATISAVSLLVQWSQDRHLAVLPVPRLGFASWLLPASVACYATARAYSESRHRGRWLAFGFLLLGLYTATGTRSSLVWLIGMATAAALTHKEASGALRRFTGFMGVAGLLVVAATGTVAGAVGIDTNTLVLRYSSITNLAANPSLDPSYSSRLLQSNLAWAQFTQSPIMGTGPGYSYYISNVLSGDDRFTIGLDSSLATLAEFGLVGIVMFVAIFLGYGLFVRKSWRDSHFDRTSVVAISGIGAICLAWLMLFGSPINDKGLSMALIGLVALAIAPSMVRPIHGVRPQFRSIGLRDN